MKHKMLSPLLDFVFKDLFGDVRRIINVEIQAASFPELTKRFVLYSAKLLTGQIKKGGDYRDIEPVVSIIILNDTLVPDDKNYYNTYRIRNVETGVELTGVLEINLLELSKLPP
ncbi:MAG: Rpn family recombination-promoting nuclease/putative transposase, partial [Treponema sp.]|nr:Rpn family recombination-promoting nuclease/putative transposase [Treponema sp.]